MLALTDRRNGNTAATTAPRLAPSEPVSNTARIERAVTELLEALGEDPCGKACAIRPGAWTGCGARLMTCLHRSRGVCR
jgi:hypothetical protein